METKHIEPPGLVNAHAHTEWHRFGNLACGDGFMPWVQRVLSLDGSLRSHERVEAAAAEMLSDGIVAAGDYGEVDSAVTRGLVKGRRYFEILRGGGIPSSADSVAIHAVHTVLRPAIEALAGKKLFLSVHAGESAEEMQLYRDASGPMAELLRERGFPEAHLSSLRHETPISVLNKLGLIGPRTQIVHAMHLSDGDLRVIADQGAHIVLCPVSNQNIGTAFLPGDRSKEHVETMIDMGISIALGTDSALSVPRLSIMDNARLLEDTGISRMKIEPMLRNGKAIGWDEVEG